jgi:predicted transcriptional regulator
MLLSEIVRIVDGTVVAGGSPADIDISLCGASDLMSDVLSHIKPKALLLTGLANPHCVRTAEMTEVAAILFVRGKHPVPEAVALAEELGIPLVCTSYGMYQACGLLYRAGLKPVM